MKNNSSQRIWIRTVLLGIFLAIIVLWVNHLFYVSRVEDARNQITLEALQEQKVLNNELHGLFHRVQDDIQYFQKKVIPILNPKTSKTLEQEHTRSIIDFLESHQSYFNLTIMTDKGVELLKFIKSPEINSYERTYQLFDNSLLPIFPRLNQVKGEDYYFSSMEPHTVKGVVQQPLQPMVMLSKRISIGKDQSGLLVLGFDGGKIHDLFQAKVSKKLDRFKTSLLDMDGYYVAIQPQNKDKRQWREIFKNATKLSPPYFIELLKNQELDQGAISLEDELVVYTMLYFPNTIERWLLISNVSNISWMKPIQRQVKGWLIWEGLLVLLILVLFYGDEVKRHRESVVKVLLKERNEFTHNVSHQLKTPLAIMLNTLENPMSKDLNRDDLTKELRHLIKVVEDLLMLAQVDSLDKLPKTSEDLLEIVSSALETVRLKAHHRGVKVLFQVDDVLLKSGQKMDVLVMGDLVKSALINLIDNAVDFSPMGGTIKVILGQNGQKFSIRIKDQGPGIPDNFRPHLFKRFSRHGSTERKGSGLGLSIAQKIIQLHKGEIRLLDSGSGAEFEIIL